MRRARGGLKRRLDLDADVRFERELGRLSRRTSPTFVKVGANDGVTGDPCGTVLLDGRWRGVLVEPVPYCVERLRTAYADRDRFSIEAVAVGRRPGTATFYFVQEEAATELKGLPEWWDQLGSFDREHIVRHLSGRLEPFIGEREVEVRTLREIVERSGLSPIDLLHVDTEGHDYEVLMSLDLELTAPQLVRIEKKHLGRRDRRSMARHLRRHGYRVLSGDADFTAIRVRRPTDPSTG